MRRFLIYSISSAVSVAGLFAIFLSVNYPENISFEQDDLDIYHVSSSKIKQIKKSNLQKESEYRRQKKTLLSSVRERGDVVIILSRKGCYSCELMQEKITANGDSEKCLFVDVGLSKGCRYYPEILYDEGFIRHPILYLPGIIKIRKGKVSEYAYYDNEKFIEKGLLYPFVHFSISYDKLME